MGTLKMHYNGELIEGHPIGVDKVIMGDLREREWDVDGEIHHIQNNEGTILYDRSEKEQLRPWFILVYESGRRCVD